MFETLEGKLAGQPVSLRIWKEDLDSARQWIIERVASMHELDVFQKKKVIDIIKEGLNATKTKPVQE